MNKFGFSGIVCAVAMFAPAIGMAQVDCIKIEDAVGRLACFDAWAASQTPEITDPAIASADMKPATVAIALTNWRTENDTSAMTDEKSVFVSTLSKDMVQCRSYGDRTEITLALRCLEKTTAVYISGDCQMASGFEGYGDVTYRVDDAKAQTRGFDASTDSSALGLWSGKHAIPFVKELFGASKLTVRFTPFGMSPIEAVFDISGAEQAVEDLRGACNW